MFDCHKESPVNSMRPRFTYLIQMQLV